MRLSIPRIVFLFMLVVAGASQLPEDAWPSSESLLVSNADTAPTRHRVKLVVLLIFDQMRGDYLDRWQPLFAENGFRRLLRNGLWYTHCHYPYATTSTGPGHASLLSGTSPAKHGVINNEWYDRHAGAEVYCAGMNRYHTVPLNTQKGKYSGTPERCLSENVADILKATTAGKGKVLAVSLKDRSAIFPAGRSPDGAYWFTGQFVTSTYYRDTLPRWVTDFNRSGIVDRWFDKTWLRLRDDLDYAKYSGPDDGPGEGTGRKQGICFPHPINGGLNQPGPAYYEALANSPFGNDLLLEFAKAGLIAEGLGQDEIPDLLSISFASNDLIGHTWGPDSQEVLDTTLRSDLNVADLLRFLDMHIGRNQYAVVLTADHGICPNPEVSAKEGKDARRIDDKQLIAAAEAFLQQEFSSSTDPGKEDTPTKPQRWIEASSPPYVYLNLTLLEAKKLDPASVAERLASWFRTQPGMLRVYTRKQLLTGLTQPDSLDRKVLASFYPERSGDLYLLLKPYYLLGSYLSGTSHGTPHPYDTHVPLLIFGPGIVGEQRDDPVTPLHATPIVADFLHLPPPRDCEYTLPPGWPRKPWRKP